MGWRNGQGRAGSMCFTTYTSNDGAADPINTPRESSRQKKVIPPIENGEKRTADSRLVTIREFSNLSSLRRLTSREEEISID